MSVKTQVIVELPLERVTKGALLYRDQDMSAQHPDFVLDGLYLQQRGLRMAMAGRAADAFNGDWPKRIRVTVEVL